jgi:dTDP-4-dehydrorhamnose 3,5-epimerase
MEIETFSIGGPVLFTPRILNDDRGYFMETFRQTVFDSAVAEPMTFVQDNQSFSTRKGTVRGLHFQSQPHGQGKLVRCTQGAIYDVAVDIRLGSPTFGQHIRVELSADNGAQLWVPLGFLHGFSTLRDDVIVQYKCTGYYAADCDGNVAWNDPDLDIDWGIDPASAVLSDKDRSAPLLRDLALPCSS